MTWNKTIQNYKGIRLMLLNPDRKSILHANAKRYMLVGVEGLYSLRSVRIPEQYLLPDGTIKPGINLDWIFQKAFWTNKLAKAGVDIDPFNWTYTPPCFNTTHRHWPKNHLFARVHIDESVLSHDWTVVFSDGMSMALKHIDGQFYAVLKNKNKATVAMTPARKTAYGLWSLTNSDKTYTVVTTTLNKEDPHAENNR